MRIFSKIFLLVCFLCFFSQVLFGQQVGSNLSIVRPYVSADIYFDRGRIIQLKKIDINKASFEQLMALPEINEDLALKIMRKRPVKSLEELVRLPYINMDRMQLILQGITGYVIQPYKVDDKELIQ